MAETRIEYLRRIIAHLDTLWEVGEDCLHPDTDDIVSNDEYDDFVAELKTLSPKEPRFTNRPSDSSAVLTGKKVKHDPPLTSIEKASHEDLAKQQKMLFNWLSSSCESPADTYDIDGLGQYAKSYFSQSYKLDGVAVALYYKKGKLVSAGLRPRNGIDGRDVTEHVKYVKGIPEQLKLPISCSIRGEIICRKSDFDKVQKELAAAKKKLRANPRNHAAGAMGLDDPSTVKDMRLSFIGYSIENLDNPSYKTEIERAKWCNKDLGVPFVQTRSFNFYDLQKMEDGRKDLDYEVDGVIIAVDNLEDQEQLGRHGDPKTGNPKGKIAWKFREEVATPVIKDIVDQVGRTGKIVPVAIFDGVQLAGTTVTRATLHNYGYVKRNGIKIGTNIKVVKAGAIIPKVIGVVSDAGKPHIPSQCPSCRGKTELVEGGKLDSGDRSYELYCHNQECPAKGVTRYEHYLRTVGVLGLGPSKIEQLLSGKVKSFADLYRLSVADVMNCGMSERQALLAVADIHMIPDSDKEDSDRLKKLISKAIKIKKKIPANQLFASFGIKGAGTSSGKELVNHFGDFHKIIDASVDELVAVKDIGQSTAEAIHGWFRKNKQHVLDLLAFIEPLLPKVGPLTGKSFCLSGTFAEGKDYWKKEIEDRGGNCVGSVGKTTSYLVAGPGSGSKSDKATSYGVTIIDVNQLKALL